MPDLLREARAHREQLYEPRIDFVYPLAQGFQLIVH
jgi:hypothetical protein